MGEAYPVSKCQEPGCKDAVETVGTWSSRLCLKHRRERFGWERSDYEAEARRMLTLAEAAMAGPVAGPDASLYEEMVAALAEGQPPSEAAFRYAEISAQMAAVYADLARGSDWAPSFAPGQPLQPFPGYSRKPPAVPPPGA